MVSQHRCERCCDVFIGLKGANLQRLAPSKYLSLQMASTLELSCDGCFVKFFLYANIDFFNLSEHTEILPSTQGSLGKTCVFIRLKMPKRLRRGHYKFTVEVAALLKTGSIA